jgi:DNA polymerase-4
MGAARDIASLVLPDLPVALARRREPSLRERPVAVARGASVVAASAEARAEGVVPGAPAAHAGSRAVVVALDSEALARVRRELGQVLNRYTPRVEIESSGAWYLDLSETAGYWGRPAVDLLTRAVAEVDSDLDLPAAGALASGKAVARMAATCRREPVTRVPAGEEAAHLADYPVAVLPEAGREQRQRLARLGLRRLGEVAAVPLVQLEAAFGRRGRWWHQWSRGVDPRPVATWSGDAEAVCDWQVGVGLGGSQQSPAAAGGALFSAAERLGRRLRDRAEQAVRLQILLTYRDGVERSRQARLEPTDRDFDLFEAALAMLESAWERRVGARRVAVAVTERRAGGQGELFPEDAAADRLFSQLDAVRDRFGEDAIRWGRGLEGAAR